MLIWNLHIVSPIGNNKLKCPTNPAAAPWRESKRPYQKAIRLSSVVCYFQLLIASCQTLGSVERPSEPAQESVPPRIAATQASQPPRDSVGWYKSNAHSISENIPPKKPPKAARITTNLLSGHPPNHLPGQISAPSPQLPRAWEGLDSLLRPVPVPFKRLQNSSRPRQLRPSPPHQRRLKSSISV